MYLIHVHLNEWACMWSSIIITRNNIYWFTQLYIVVVMDMNPMNLAIRVLILKSCSDTTTPWKVSISLTAEWNQLVGNSFPSAFTMKKNICYSHKKWNLCSWYAREMSDLVKVVTWHYTGSKSLPWLMETQLTDAHLCHQTSRVNVTGPL